MTLMALRQRVKNERSAYAILSRYRQLKIKQLIALIGGQRRSLTGLCSGTKSPGKFAAI
jgi:hypothetical protein